MNRLDQTDEGCRLFIDFTNDLAFDLSELGFELVLFDADGQVHGLWELKSGRVGQGRSRLKAFNFADVACDAIARARFNYVFECTATDAELAADVCLDAVTLSSAAGVPLADR